MDFKKLWEWVTAKQLLPLLFVMVSAAFTVGKFAATVNAQTVKVTSLEEKTETKLQKMEESVERVTGRLRQDVVSRLDDIKVAQRSLDQKLESVRTDMDSVKDTVSDLKSDLSVVCSKVRGGCPRR